MARTLRIRKDGNAHYHVMSRTNNKLFLFEKGSIKRTMVELLERTAAFSGVEIDAYCMMDNHFHAVVHVIKPDEPVSEAEVIRRIGILKGARFAEALADHWAELRGMDMALVVDAQVELWRRRMHDVSQFVKTYKELVNIAYKAMTNHVGSIWSGRFASTLVEDGEYLATCVRYVELNPVRAGMVHRAEAYAYSSRNSAKPLQNSAFAGPGPAGAVVEEGRLMRRVMQIGAGKIFGSRAYVMSMIVTFSDRFASGRVTARPVMGSAFASHGQKVAA